MGSRFQVLNLISHHCLDILSLELTDGSRFQPATLDLVQFQLMANIVH